SYGKEVIDNPGCAGHEIILGEDEYFVLGDNRNNSMDSRDERVGLIHREELIGRALIRIYPFDRMGTLDGRQGT
ncbi:MAG: signal peptidase I, partial [Clostridiales bacterium]|nr:signal peptidase I [Clostridiales bacterium]